MKFQLEDWLKVCNAVPQTIEQQNARIAELTTAVANAQMEKDKQGAIFDARKKELEEKHKKELESTRAGLNQEIRRLQEQVNKLTSDNSHYDLARRAAEAERDAVLARFDKEVKAARAAELEQEAAQQEALAKRKRDEAAKLLG